MNQFITKTVIGITLPFLLLTQAAKSQSVISGHLFNDLNNNGSFDANEGINTVTIWLMDDAAVSPWYQVYPVQTTTTSTDGNYSFSNVGNGNYLVRVKISTLEKPSAGVFDPVLTRSIADNNPYHEDNNADASTIINIPFAGTYNNLDFGFKPNPAVPASSPKYRFAFDNGTNSFIGVTSKTFDLTADICNGVTNNPTLTISTDRQCTVSSQVYPVAGCNSCFVAPDWPGPNKGGYHTDDITLQMNFGQSCYSAVNNDRASLTASFSNMVSDVHFTIYDIDCTNPQLVDGSIDHVKVTGYNGANTVMPVIILAQANPFNTISGNNISGWADYPDNNAINNYPDTYNSGNADNGNAEIYFTDVIDRFVIEYEEIAPLAVLSVKKIQVPVSPINNESQWGAPATPATRAISIGSIGYSLYCKLLAADDISFDAMAAGQQVKLQWKTGNEQQLQQYRVERLSANGSWTALGNIATTGSNFLYHFTDLQPLKDVNQYRIVLLNKDGSSRLSAIRKVVITANTEAVDIINNPASILNLVVYGAAKEIIVFDAAGQSLYDHPVQHTNPSGSTLITLNEFQLHTGFYFVKTLFADGEVRTVKFMKN